MKRRSRRSQRGGQINGISLRQLPDSREIAYYPPGELVFSSNGIPQEQGDSFVGKKLFGNDTLIGNIVSLRFGGSNPDNYPGLWLRLDRDPGRMDHSLAYKIELPVQTTTNPPTTTGRATTTARATTTRRATTTARATTTRPATTTARAITTASATTT